VFGIHKAINNHSSHCKHCQSIILDSPTENKFKADVCLGLAPTLHPHTQ
jgi:hypothetical protein